MAARPTKVLGSAAAAIVVASIWLAFNGPPDCNATLTAGRVTFPFCNGIVAGASPRCFRWPVRLGRRVLDRLQVPSVDAGGPVYDYGYAFAALRAGEAASPQAVLDAVAAKLQLDDADDVPDPGAVEEITCPGSTPRAAIVARSHASYDSECRCGPGCLLDGTATIRGPSGHYDRIEGGRWTVVDAPTCVPTPCTLSQGSPFLPGACQ